MQANSQKTRNEHLKVIQFLVDNQIKRAQIKNKVIFVTWMPYLGRFIVKKFIEKIKQSLKVNEMMIID